MGGVTAEDLRALLDALPFDLWLRDRDQVCVYANPHAVARWPGLVGSAPEQGGGRPEVVAIWRANNDRAMAGEIVRGEVRYELEGRVGTYVNIIAPVRREKEGEIVGTAGINLDVTELRTLEAGLLRADRLASLGTMAAGVAHEINNPLSFVQVNLAHSVSRLEAMMKEPGREGLDGVVESLRIASAGVDRIAGLAREMLQLARVPAERFETTADVRVTVDSVLALAGGRLRAAADVEHAIGDVPRVKADAMKLGQVLLNLLTNSAQAIESRGERGRIWIRAAASEGNVVLRVEDDGPGIPPELRARLFSPFQTTRGEGNGLGLFLCRRLVTEMGGAIDAFSRDGGGTEMRIVLPAA